jgi:predicted DNA-binding ribbon-helix-helix protein
MENLILNLESKNQIIDYIADNHLVKLAEKECNFASFARLSVLSLMC